MCIAHNIFSLIFCQCLFYFFLDVRLEMDERSRGKKQTAEASITKWIRKDFDADGYFLLQFVDTKQDRNRTVKFLTADNVSSLTLQGKCSVAYVRSYSRVLDTR